MVPRNVAVAVTAPRRKASEVEILDGNQITPVLAGMAGTWLHPVATLAFATGMRRGELLALRWRDIGNGVVKVERSLEQTKGKLRFKSPKTSNGRRSITLPASAVTLLDQHRREQLELQNEARHGEARCRRLGVQRARWFANFTQQAFHGLETVCPKGRIESHLPLTAPQPRLCFDCCRTVGHFGVPPLGSWVGGHNPEHIRPPVPER